MFIKRIILLGGLMGLKKVFAKNLKELRKRNKMTQEQLAELVNVAPRHISFIETGRSFPSCELLERLCAVLHTSAFEFFSTEEELSQKELMQKLSYLCEKLDKTQLNFLVIIAEELY